jgi:hypothetical protein
MAVLSLVELAFASAYGIADTKERVAITDGVVGRVGVVCAAYVCKGTNALLVDQ